MTDLVDNLCQTQSDTAERNTIYKFRAVFFTWNNYPNNAKELLIEHFDKYHFQPEIGDTANTAHLQGVGYFKNARTLEQINKLFKGIHIEKPKNWNACIEYYKKLKTKAGELVSNIDIKIDDPLSDKELYIWQIEILNIINTKPNDRKIYWYYDKDGAKGKTSFAKHLCINSKNTLYLNGKVNDCKYAVCEFIKKNELKVVIFDFVRSYENFISYDAIESIKNGIFFNTKYESKMCLFNTPHIFIFANFEPITENLSKDRWIIKTL